MTNNNSVYNKVLKAFKKKLDNMEDYEILNLYDSLQENTYSKKVNSRIESDRESNKIMILINSSIVFDDDFVVKDDDTVNWINDVSKDNDIFIYSENCKDETNIQIMKNNLLAKGLNESNSNNVMFVSRFIDKAIFIYDKNYIYQGKLPSISVIKEIAER